MIRRYLIVLLSFLSLTAFAQTASSVLDATAKKLTSVGTYANFSTIIEGQSLWGNIAIKGNMFKITSANAITWYDGKTQWTLMKSTNEVSISSPDAEQQELINPYHFINMYKKGYSSSIQKKKGIYIVTLKRTSAKSEISDAIIEINSSTSFPLRIKVKTGGKWTAFNISGAKNVNYYKSHFRFNKKNYPKAEIIDLR